MSVKDVILKHFSCRWPNTAFTAYNTNQSINQSINLVSL